MQAPTVHLEALATQLHAMEPHLEELVSLQPAWHTVTQTLQPLPLCLCLRCGNAPLQWIPTPSLVTKDETARCTILPGAVVDRASAGERQRAGPEAGAASGTGSWRGRWPQGRSLPTG